ncbi:hypothetical protein [Mycolicibacterium fortuitum]|uniref:Uncharacterized protein n=2 Tax=Mycolicibacterium fortuitum TaxID=1766 RepID=A0AAE4VHJ0_MYCFO|nr:hypothetical protein [Mycolicibacterium fortuitum]MCV7143241.1 hypothetical protein [Mycolicibacterium fortuitum]MDV7193609.1 hypothetical protein [Mycolicibacterium fortuitum]MDV7208347.1 hypothetical protein [Mycolicibacterium fortuitum]MDV7230316.1 hypothetical protein [Mycolicibacterium fortuitum]MDV7257123.1 hypothetical protein [Mycolicibacterium fortuitum]
MAHGSRCPENTRRLPLRYGLSVVAIGIGIAGASAHPVAWADPGTSGTGASSSSGQSSSHSSAGTNRGPKKPGDRLATRPGRKSPLSLKAPDRGATGTTADDPATGLPSNDDRTPAVGSPAAPPSSPAAQRESIADFVRGKLRDFKPAAPLRNDSTRPARSDFSPRAAAERLDAVAPATRPGSVPSRMPALMQSLAPASKAALPDLSAAVHAAPDSTAKVIPLTTKVAAVTTTTETTTETTPKPPEPLSPIAKIAELPGRIVNTVLQVLDITVSANGPKSPIDLAPINNALFAAFREIEGQLGLTKTPAAQPVPPTMTYDGPTTGTTPTVSQFLNAATAAYVWGGTPGDLKPFVVNGKQMESTNVLTGMSGKAWVTPEGQIIIAYQGTTGGTNLLHNPLIAISQVIADTQVIFTDTPPQAFIDSVAFEQQVEAAAIAQGYRKEDIFVTGHSLGGWEAAYVAQQTGVGGVGFESPGLNTTVPGNGADSGFVNVLTYGDTAAYFSTDLPGLQPFMPEYVPGGGTKPHYGAIVMIGNPDAAIPLMNSAALLNTGPIGAAIFVADILVNFLQYHLPGIQAYHLGVTPDPGVVPWLGNASGPVNADYADMTIPELKKAASDAGTLIRP